MADSFGKCGCNCGKCHAFIGNIKSEEDKAKCSEGWKNYLNISLKADKCVCFGCQAKEPWQTGNMLPDRSCIVKKCAEKSGFKTCAHCSNFPCSFLEERSRNDYYREWVEKRVGRKITEEEYETFVQPYETYKNIKKLRETLNEEEISPQKPVEPLKTKISVFPGTLKQGVENERVLRNTYDFLTDLLQCRSKTYVQQTINERRIKPALVILWVFAVYGEYIDGDHARLVISSKSSDEKPEFGNIIRKRDNTWHGSAGQVAFLLRDYGFNMEFKALPGKQWTIALSAGDNNRGFDVIRGLKMFAGKLIEKHGIPEYVSAWRYKGNAFKYFEKADFNIFA